MMPMMMEANPSKKEFSVRQVRRIPKGDGEAEDGRRIFQKNDEYGRCIRLTDRFEKPASSNCPPHLPEGDPPGISIKNEGKGEDQKSRGGMPQRLGMEDLVDPTVDGEDRPDDED